MNLASFYLCLFININISAKLLWNAISWVILLNCYRKIQNISRYKTALGDSSISRLFKNKRVFRLLPSLPIQVAPPRPLRVCVLRATLVGHLTACSIVCVVDFLSMHVLTNSVFASVFFVVSTVFSFLLVVLLIFFSFFFFSGPRSGASSVSDPGLLAKFIINK